MKNNIHTTLINNIFADDTHTDKLDASSVFPITDSSSKDLADSLMIHPEFSVAENTFYEKIADYIDTLLPPKHQVYDPQLSKLLKDLTLAQKEENIDTSYILAEKIFTEYSKILSFEHAITILLIFVENDLVLHNYNQVFVSLRGLEATYPLFTYQQKKTFDFYIAQCFLYFGLQYKDRTYLYKAILHSQRVLRSPENTKEELNICLYVIIKSFETLGIYDECMSAIEEYLHIFPASDTNNILTPEVLLIQKSLTNKNI